MAVLDLLNRLASRAIGRHYEETITVVPRASGPYARAGDPARPTRTVSAVVSIARIDETLAATNAGGDFRKGRFVGVSDSTVWISAAQVATLGYEIQTGDQIILSSRPGEPRYSVMFPGPNDLGDLSVTITSEDAL